MDWLADLFGTLTGYFGAREDRQSQQQENAADRTFNSEQARIDRGFAAVQANVARHENRMEAERAFQRNYDMQKEFAQHGISWKMEDAVSAGINPNYAIGAAGVTPHSIPVQGSTPPAQSGGPARANSAPLPLMAPALQAMGQAIGNTIARTLDPNMKLRDQLELESLKLQNEKDAVMVGYYASEAMRNRMQALMLPSPFNRFGQDVAKVGATQIIPSEIVSRDAPSGTPGGERTAGTKPAWDRVEVAPGIMMDVPRSDEGLSESLEGWGLPLALYKNFIWNPLQPVGGWIGRKIYDLSHGGTPRATNRRYGRYGNR